MQPGKHKRTPSGGAGSGSLDTPSTARGPQTPTDGDSTNAQAGSTTLSPMSRAGSGASSNELGKPHTQASTAGVVAAAAAAHSFNWLTFDQAPSLISHVHGLTSAPEPGPNYAL